VSEDGGGPFTLCHNHQVQRMTGLPFNRSAVEYLEVKVHFRPTLIRREVINPEVVRCSLWIGSGGAVVRPA
jgi:hypothetical protein